MRFTIAAAGALVSLLASYPANARYVSSDPVARRIIYQYGTCAVKDHPEKASEAVLSNVDGFTLKKKYSALIDESCLRPIGRLAFPGDFYLYVLADALVARELTVAQVTDLSGVPPLGKRPIATFAELKRRFGYDAALSATYYAAIFDALDEYGECIVRKSPANAKALLMTEPGSTDEATRFDALQSALSECRPESKTIELNETQIRGTVAFNYYRLAQAVLHVPVH